MLNAGQNAPIQLERVYEASVEDVWALWTTKEGLEEWFAPTGCRLEMTVLDVREGGAFEHTATAVSEEAIAYHEREGRSLTARVRGTFVEVRPYQRLHLRFAMDFLPGVEPYPYDMMVELFPEGESVRMVVKADQHRQADVTRLAAQVLGQQLDVFAEALTRRRGSSS